MFGLNVSVARIRSAIAGALLTFPLILTTNIGVAGAAGTSAATSTIVATTASSSVAIPSTCQPAVHFSSGLFSNPTRIDNQFLPVVPGTQFVMDGSIVAGASTGPTNHRVIFTVTDLTKVIDGVRTRVIWDQDYDTGQLVESELAFQAQDDRGNVWLLGEYPEEYDWTTGHSVFAGAPFTWITGVRGALGGLLMRGSPKLGTPGYLQAVSPSISFLDCAQVLQTGQRVSTPAGSFRNVLVTNEWSPLQGPGTQQKYHAPGVGVIQVGDTSDPEAEILTLTSVKKLDANGIASARASALKLDRHGYTVSDVYERTAPAR